MGSNCGRRARFVAAADIMYQLRQHFFMPKQFKVADDMLPSAPNGMKPAKRNGTMSSKAGPRLFLYYATNPYLTFILSSFSSIGSAANHSISTVAAAWTRSRGKPVM